MATPFDSRPPPPPLPPRPEQRGRTPAPAPASEPLSGSASTLLVRHLPEGIPDEMLSRLFSYYGASSYRRCSGGRLRNCAFVDFKDENSASLAQSQLHRLRFHKKVLSVERASNVSSENRILPGGERAFKDSAIPAAQVKDSSVAGKNSGTNAMSMSTAEPIAPRLGVDYPFPPHLEYDYPPPDGNILTNIVNALIAVPRFYTQVLHLMNKMNIPAPFRMALPTPPLPPSVPAPPPPPPPPVMEKPPQASSSSEESEMESSEEEDGGKTQRRKRLKREAIVGPASDKAVAHEDVGLKPAALIPKEVPLIKKKNPVLQIKIASKSAQSEAKDGESSFNAELDPSIDNMEAKPYATPPEIEKGKLPPEEILSLPMFKNYTAGNPATVLYIKNLAKDVVTDDFYFIFGSFFGGIEATKSALSIKLMQEGRMRGQAFVTFPSVDIAQHALKLVNGYVFKGKPMIIQFGRNPTAAKAN